MKVRKEKQRRLTHPVFSEKTGQIYEELKKPEAVGDRIFDEGK